LTAAVGCVARAAALAGHLDDDRDRPHAAGSRRARLRRGGARRPRRCRSRARADSRGSTARPRGRAALRTLQFSSQAQQRNILRVT